MNVFQCQQKIHQEILRYLLDHVHCKPKMDKYWLALAQPGIAKPNKTFLKICNIMLTPLSDYFHSQH